MSCRRWTRFAAFIKTVPATVQVIAVEAEISGHTANRINDARTAVPDLERALSETFTSAIPKLLIHPPAGALFSAPEEEMLLALFPQKLARFERPRWLCV